ncbi:MAG TPA: polymorphic toxin-type HINT domain-containing protein, partial [Candidatus Bathyarchaeia archaeon]|nr:polymorphic toxin-type HINT domain-containing protein [Candidatus Bathyarchaeia archaeon]
TTSDGKELAIERIEVRKEHNTVYNFKVKDFHTYFVSNLGIWTHNRCDVTPEGSGNFKWKSSELMDELSNSGVKYNPDDVLAVTKTPDGKLVWLENGNSKAGLEHIMNHAEDFAKKGIERSEIPDLVMEALNQGKLVGYQGKGTGRPIYEVVFNGQKQRVAITVGNNGFIVGANPSSIP